MLNKQKSQNIIDLTEKLCEVCIEQEDLHPEEIFQALCVTLGVLVGRCAPEMDTIEEALPMFIDSIRANAKGNFEAKHGAVSPAPEGSTMHFATIGIDKDTKIH